MRGGIGADAFHAARTLLPSNAAPWSLRSDSVDQRSDRV
jgi:hypothetical protein